MAKHARSSLTLPLLLVLAGCGGGGDDDGGTGGTGGGPSTQCKFESSFDASQCPKSFPPYQCNVFVDGDVSSAGDGWSWSGALRTVQEGVDLARCGALGTSVCSQWQVWVKRGTYYSYRTCSLDTLWMLPDVGVYGGFNGTESSLYDRDPVANETILDGRDGPDGANHVYHVVAGADGSLLSGFTVQFGRADDAVDGVHRLGGGFGAVSALATVEDCVFRDNFASSGAGLTAFDSSVTVKRCRFENNRANTGAGIYGLEGAHLVVHDSVLVGNEATGNGGAAQSDGGTLTLVSSVFQGNSADSHGGAVGVAIGAAAKLSGCSFAGNTAAWGGGVAAWAESAITIGNCGFEGNEAKSEDPEKHPSGGGVSLDGSTAVVTDCSFIDNASELDGGGFAANKSPSVSVTGSTFKGNSAAKHGGGLGANASTVSVSDCTFESNTAERWGAGLSNVDGDTTVKTSKFTSNETNGPEAEGGGLSILNGTGEVVGCAFEKNKATGCGGGLIAWYGASVEVRGSTFENNESPAWGGGIAADGGELTVGTCSFKAHSAPQGGAIDVSNATASVERSIFEANQASFEGGAIAAYGLSTLSVTNSALHSNVAMRGSGIHVASGIPLSLIHCTLAANVATQGGAVDGAEDLTLTSSILWNPGAPAELTSCGAKALAVGYSDIRDYPASGTNLSQDPKLVDVAAGDLHLQAGSVCIDKGKPDGAPTEDLEGKPRNGVPDMGAYEYQ